MGTVIEVAARMTVPVALAVAGICLVVLALLTGPQAARLVRHGTPPPRPRRFWLTLLVAREIGTAGAAAAVAWAALASGALPAWAAALAAGAVAFLVAEAVAPGLGLAVPNALADRVADGVDRVLAPLRRPLERPAVVVASWVAGESGLSPSSVLRFAADGAVEEDEEAALDAPGRELLGRLREFRQRPVRAVMTPRLRIVALPVDLPGPALLAALYEHRFSRLPVYRSDRDNVIGTLYAKDLCGLDLAAPGFRLEPLLRPPIFVPLGMPAGDVFRELRRRKVHLALVVDEYGGIAGLVTMEDLLGELFGDVADEYGEARAR
ncbi:MAG: CBS domain-containing protein [Deltaproteobacteria bacterium]|nr:MAG: CBS domain-containing protein [Deltaproteobacteria bacterium]